MINCFVPYKLLEIYKIIWTTIEDSQEIALPVYDGRYIKTILRAYAYEVYTNFRSLNVSEDGVRSIFRQLCL